MTRQEQKEAADILERLAAVVAQGEVTAPSGFVGRLEGGPTQEALVQEHTAAHMLQ